MIKKEIKGIVPIYGMRFESEPIKQNLKKKSDFGAEVKRKLILELPMTIPIQYVICFNDTIDKVLPNYSISKKGKDK